MNQIELRKLLLQKCTTMDEINAIISSMGHNPEDFTSSGLQQRALAFVIQLGYDHTLNELEQVLLNN